MANDPKDAPDGDSNTLRSGKWPTDTSIPLESFPAALMLLDADKALATKAPGKHVLVSTRVGRETFELLLSCDARGVALSMQVPTAPNQFKEPYVLMEAEAGNRREDVVRDVQFHLQGRVSEAAVKSTDWAAIFRVAAKSLEALRRR